MKKLLSLITCALLSVSAFAQTNDNTQIKQDVIAFAQNVASNRSLTLAVYPSYAPDIVVNGRKDTFGMGVAALVPTTVVPALHGNAVAQHAFVGLRFDYLAHQAYASTVGVGLRGDMQLWGHNFEGFTQASANVPFSGFGIHNGELGAAVGGGIYTDIYTFSHGSLGLQISAEKWTQFSGFVLHGGPVLSISF